jgi:hypothetical protein
LSPGQRLRLRFLQMNRQKLFFLLRPFRERRGPWFDRRLRRRRMKKDPANPSRRQRRRWPAVVETMLSVFVPVEEAN